MTLYVDTSAFLKRYVDEPDSDVSERILFADPLWTSARHTHVELRRNLVRVLKGEPLGLAREQFERDWERIQVVEVDALTCQIAGDIAEITGARTLDALHLAAASRLGKAGVTFVTFDLRQAQAARTLGFTVLGA